MFSFKWHDDYKAIRTAQDKVKREGGPFDLDRLGADSWSKRLRLRVQAWVFGVLFRLSRKFWPIIKLGRFVIVSRAADISYVLEHPDTFEVPYGLEMTELAGGENFVLGMEGSSHDDQRALIMQAIQRDDQKLVAALSRQVALTMIQSSGGRIDVMKDLMTRVASEACIRYFGLAVDDADAYADWTLPISTLMFADPNGDPATRRLALEGAARVRAVIARSIHLNKSGAGPAEDNLLARLLAVAAANPTLTEAKITSILVGLSTGFIPTNTLAAGKILEELLRRPEALRAATNAARAAEALEKQSGSTATNTHKQELERILFEAARLNPALAPGQFRYARQDGIIKSADGRATHIARGSVLMAATMSALRDSAVIERPNAFDPNRRPADIALMFGTGVHDCIGKYLAMVQITETFQVLLAQDNLRVAKDRWGTMRWTGPFPTRLDMEFDSGATTATQDMLTICAPLKHPSAKETVRQLIDGLEKTGALETSLKATNIVHFASLAVIDAGDEKESKPYLLLELNVDGTQENAIRTIALATQKELGEIFDHTPVGGSALTKTFSSYALDLKTTLWGGATGLNFNGTPEFQVADIERQKGLAAFARNAFTTFVEINSGIGNRALPAVRFIRGLMREDPACLKLADGLPDEQRQKIALLMAEGKQFKDMLALPSRKRLRISEWNERSNEDAAYPFLKSRDFLWLASPLVIVALLVGLGIYFAIEPGASFNWVSRLLVSIAGGMVTTVILALIVATIFVLLLRYHERTDVPDDRYATLSEIRAASAREDRPGYAQNHFMAVTLLKPGWFRKLTLVLSLWGIKQLVTHAYRPGFVLNMGTIHYAKWFRLPKTDKLIFLSNFDGSWESYLEDFITKAHAGQTAAWCHGVGFPKTRMLIYEGAQDGDRFKRWVRRQQVPSQFWYSRFPDLTTDQIRNNAVIHQGLARANSDTAAMNWLSCFGSMQRPDRAIEADEVQSLMFRGFAKSQHAGYALLKLPDLAAGRKEWLEGLLPGKLRQDGSRDKNVKLPAFRQELAALTFGDHPVRDNPELSDLVAFVAFSATGLKKFGLPVDGGDGSISGFSSAFNLGMANRARVLGDKHDGAPKWRWSDAARDEAGDEWNDGVPAVDAILIVYSSDPAQCEAALKAQRAKLGDDAFVAEIYSKPVRNEGDSNTVFREHFGFRDGISQPVIRGTQRIADSVAERDIVEPGEFILGYRNNQGYYPPAINVSAATDVGDRLPDVIADTPPQFPSFRSDGARDFGRNGSYLVVRQIQQHVKQFESFTKTAANTHNRTSTGAKVDADWIAAKMMGRWKNSGEPLVLRPVKDERIGGANPDMATNDFAYAQEDPQGLRCPFGAHIRRANPRDGLRPDDSLQQSITNRHRLLRRGRTYDSPATGTDDEAEKGIVFTCLCADLERQFEFVQQTWIGSSSFHGLTGEVDPVIGSPDPATTRFTIPTPSGPITLEGLQSFVTVRAGGYFFMPSYSALLYLLDRSEEEARSQQVHSRTSESGEPCPPPDRVGSDAALA